MQQLYYPNEVRSMSDLDIGDATVKDNELKMAVQLAEMGATEEFHPEQYRDEVSERVRELIQRKIEGEEITAGPAEEPRAQVIDLMEALRASLAKPNARTSASAAKPAAKAPAKAPTNIEAKRKPAKPAARRAATATKARAK